MLTSQPSEPARSNPPAGGSHSASPRSAASNPTVPFASTGQTVLLDGDDTQTTRSASPSATLHQSNGFYEPSDTAKEYCLVQIYPPDVVDGMLLLEEDVFVAGRDWEADLVLEDGGVSRRHCQWVRTAEGFELHDLGSTNGTRVNGELVDRYKLHSGDIIQVGAFLFKFLSAGSVESQYHETVYSLMTRDALTGAMNKRYLLETLHREVARSVRHVRPLSVVMLDIDHFKSVNDTRGHLVGDDVLREFAARVQAVCREDDMLGRYGGEEFCLILTEADRQEAIAKAEACRQNVIHRPFDTVAGPLAITASFGVASLEDSNCDQHSSQQRADCLLSEADQKLYRAKREGRDRVIG